MGCSHGLHPPLQGAVEPSSNSVAPLLTPTSGTASSGATPPGSSSVSKGLRPLSGLTLPTPARNSRKKFLTAGDGGYHGPLLVIRVLRGHLVRSFDKYGKMDPFAIVEWVDTNGMSWEIARTRTDWGGHMQPKWDHTCRGVPCDNPADCFAHFQVLEKNFSEIGIPTFCGSGYIAITELMNFRDPPGVWSHVRPVILSKHGKETGSLTVQAMILESSEHTDMAGNLDSGQQYTFMDAGLFLSPARRVGVSGGTAPFFHLRLQSPEEGELPDRWIGKDLSRASDEIAFYEHASCLISEGDIALAPLFPFMFAYCGVVEVVVEDQPSTAPPRQLLVLENLHAGCEKLRMLDIKIGQKTAAAGWMGKSMLASMRKSVVDGLTNSWTEGFRLEGFDNCPWSLKSIQPLLDFRLLWSQFPIKKAFRALLQLMPAAEMLMYFLDTHHTPADGPLAVDHDRLLPLEVAEIVLSEVVSRLGSLAIACRRVPVPQKWIGSSVALGYDCGSRPLRDGGEAIVRKKVRVNIFDWGRAELNTVHSNMEFSAKEQADRSYFWQLYKGGLDRLSWEAARAYKHRFCNADQWTEVILRVMDFEAIQSNEFIGEARLPLQPMKECRVPLLSSQSLGLRGNGRRTSQEHASLTLVITYHDLPKGSRIRGLWRVKVVNASNLSSSTDAYISVIAVSKDSQYCFRQDSTVVQGSSNPEWNEVFELALAREGMAEEAFGRELLGPTRTYECLEHMQSSVEVNPVVNTDTQQGDRSAIRRPSLQSVSGAAVDEGLQLWQAALNLAAATRSQLPTRRVATDPEEADEAAMSWELSFHSNDPTAHPVVDGAAVDEPWKSDEPIEQQPSEHRRSLEIPTVAVPDVPKAAVMEEVAPPACSICVGGLWTSGRRNSAHIPHLVSHHCAAEIAGVKGLVVVPAELDPPRTGFVQEV